MNTRPVDALHSWSGRQKNLLSSIGIAIEYVESPNAESRSARVDLESESVLGRATVWDTGFCDLELLSIETGEQLMFLHHEDVTGTRVAPLLDDLAKRMAQPRTPGRTA